VLEKGSIVVVGCCQFVMRERTCHSFISVKCICFFQMCCETLNMNLANKFSIALFKFNMFAPTMHYV